MDFASKLDGFFGITSKGSTLRTEVKGGILVFLAMSYIIVVNSAMMADAGIDRDAAFTATVVMSIIGSLIMGLYAKFPVAMAPGMGINAMFCYTAVLTLGFTWQEALVIVTVTGVRQKLLDKIPVGVKAGIVAGIGCFIAFIGLQNAHIIVDDPSTLVALGDMSDLSVLLGVFCIVITVLLVAHKSSIGILGGMIVTAIVGVLLGIIDLPDTIVASPTAPPVGAFLDGLSSDIFSAQFIMLIIAFSFVEFFDGSGTLMAVGKRAGIMDEDGNVTCEKALSVDAGIASLSGVIGCTPTTAFAESAVGIEAGARTGLVAVVVALLFACALFIAPVFTIFSYSCTVGAMVVVGAAMMKELRGVDWDDLPTILTIILMMMLSYSITNGIAFGVIMYCVSMIGAKRAKEVSPILYGLAVVFLIYLVACALEL